MSVLVLGGDRINPIRDVLNELGADRVIHWTARNQKNSRKKDKTIPSEIDIVLMLTNFLNHNSMKHYKAESKIKGLPVIYAKRNIESVKNGFLNAIKNLDK